MTALSATEVEAYLAEIFPQVAGYLIEQAGADGARVRLAVAERHLRPGGTVSGPTMFELADLAMYAAVLAQVGRVPLLWQHDPARPIGKVLSLTEDGRGLKMVAGVSSGCRDGEDALALLRRRDGLTPRSGRAHV